MSSVANAEAEAEDANRNLSVTVAESLVAEQIIAVSSDPVRLPQLVDARCKLALAHSRADDLQTAARCYRDAIHDCEIAEIEVGPEIGFRLFGLLGSVLDTARQDEDCRFNYRMALAFADKCAPCRALAVPIAGVHNNLGQQLQRCGEAANAVEHYRQALDLLTDEGDDEPPSSFRHLRTAIDENLGKALIELGDFRAARSQLADALSSLRKHHGPHAVTPEIRRCFQYLQTVFEKLGNDDTANACAQRAEA